MARKRRGYPRLSKEASKVYVRGGGGDVDDDRRTVDDGDETELISDSNGRRNSTSTIETTSESEEDATPLFDVPPASIFADDSKTDTPYQVGELHKTSNPADALITNNCE